MLEPEPGRFPREPSLPSAAEVGVKGVISYCKIHDTSSVGGHMFADEKGSIQVGAPFLRSTVGVKPGIAAELAAFR